MCRFSPVRRYSRAVIAPLAGSKDTLIVDILKDDLLKDTTRTENPAQLLVRIDGVVRDTIAAGAKSRVLVVAPMALLAHRVSISRFDAKGALCDDTPLSSLAASVPGSGYVTHTDFTASGEVSDALNSGAAPGAAATGSLGFHNFTYADAQKDTAGFLYPIAFASRMIQGVVAHIPFFGNGFQTYMRRHRFVGQGPSVGIQETRASIIVAGTADSLLGQQGAGRFTEAVLLPLQGRGSSAQLEYSPLHPYGEGHQRIGLVGRFSVNRQRWSLRAPISAEGKDTVITRTTVLMAPELRVRWIPINHESTTDANSFSLALEAGYIERFLLGDGASHQSYSPTAGDATFLQRALTASTTARSAERFTGYATGIYISLRHVTAYADLICLGCAFPGFAKGMADTRRIQGLEGVQPVIGFRFEAPFFTLIDK